MKTKRLISALIVIIGFAVSNLFGQGRINFSNTSATPILIVSTYWDASDTPHYYGTNILGTASTATFGIGPASVEVRLFAGLTSTSLSPVSIGSTFQGFVRNTASLVSGLQGTFNGGNDLPLVGFDGSAPVFLQFTVFSPEGWYGGVSPIIQFNLATGDEIATRPFSATPTANQWNGIVIGYPPLTPGVPEPGPGVLLAWGAGAVAVFRSCRRK